jgi:type II secretory pathway pseudopilin PulG
MDRPSHSYGSAGANKVGAIDRNRPGGSGEPPLSASRRALALRRGGSTLAKQRDPESIRGFTLVELLIATGITVAMVLMLGWMLGSLMRGASHTTTRVDAFRDARAALQMIERDLRNLVRTQWNPDPFTNPTPTPGTVQPVTRPAAYFALDNLYTDTATGNQQLYALVADQTTPSSGDVCAVGYYCRWDDQVHAYSLRRFFRNSSDTFTIIQGAGSYAADSILYAPGVSDAVLAAYVWNLKITMYNTAGAVINTYPYICDPNATTPNPLPAAIEISFNAMSPQAARAVMSVTSDPSVWINMDPNLVKPHAYQFRSRINLP